MMIIKTIKIDDDKIEEFSRKHRIKKLSLFGSVLREDFRPDSDIDVLVEFDKKARVSFFKLADIQDELRSLFNVKEIDLVTVKALSPAIKDDVLNEARVVYAQR